MDVYVYDIETCILPIHKKKELHEAQLSGKTLLQLHAPDLNLIVMKCQLKLQSSREIELVALGS